MIGSCNAIAIAIAICLVGWLVGWLFFCYEYPPLRRLSRGGILDLVTLPGRIYGVDLIIYILSHVDVVNALCSAFISFELKGLCPTEDLWPCHHL